MSRLGDLLDRISIFPWLVGHRTQILGAAILGLQIAAAAGGIPLDPAMIDLITKGLGGLAAVTGAQKLNRLLQAYGGKIPVPVPALLLVLALGTAGCGLGGVGIPVDRMLLSFEAKGLVNVPKKGLGVVEVPQGELAVVLFDVAVAPYLERETELKRCKVATTSEPADPSVGGVVTLNATVICRVGPNKTRVREVVTLTLEPAP